MFIPNQPTTIDYAQVRFDEAGTPESTDFSDIYFTRNHGIAESRYVFLAGNQLSNRFQAHDRHTPFIIAETGFGTGLNVLLASALFLQQAATETRLHIVSIERYPLHPVDLRHALTALVEVEATIEEFIEPLCDQYPPAIQGIHRIRLHNRITLDLIFDDALRALPAWAERHPNQVDAWFLDGFAPKKNPQMWHATIYRAIAISLRNGGSLATFTAVGAVRRGLQNAGLTLQKVPGFGSKRDMLVGRKHILGLPQPQKSPGSILIIGSGIAAANLAWSLRDYPGALQVWADSEPGSRASGNAQGAVYPLLQAQWTPTSAFYSAAFLYARARYQQLTPQYAHFHGVLEFSKAESDDATSDYKRLRSIHRRNLYPSELFEMTTAAQAASCTTLSPPLGAAVHPRAGWIEPAAVVKTLFEQTHAYREQRQLSWETHWNHDVKSLTSIDRGWRVAITNDKQADFTTVILACGERINTLLGQHALPIRPVRGQVTYLNADHETLINLRQVLCRGHYAIPPRKDLMCVGATFDKTRQTADYIADDNVENLAQFNQAFGMQVSELAIAGGRAGVRATTPDHLPIFGQIERFSSISNHSQVLPGLYVITGLGARGLTSAPLAAEAVASLVSGTPSPIPSGLERYFEPRRFLQRASKQQANTCVPK